jgi:lipopolysaccharide export LptBFGC system permease protein LptF
MGSLFKRNFLRSLGLALGASIATYLLAWGLFITHQELDIAGQTPLLIALWVFPIVLIGSLIVYAAKSSGSRRL